MSLRRSPTWIAILVLATFTVTGCDLFGSNDDPTTVVTDVVVANSGNFSAQDGSLTLYNPDDSTATLNDINVAFINSLSLRNDRLYVIDNTQSNNAGRVTTFDTEDLEPIDQVSNPRPPRSIAFVSDTKAYVTNLSRFDDNFNPKPSTVSIVDLSANEVTGRINVGRLPEGIVVTAGKAFVANSADSTVTVIDTETDAVTETLNLDCARPKEAFVDGEGEVAVVCKGSGANDAQVVFLNPETEQVTARLPLNANVASANATQAAYYSADAEELYAVSGGAFGGGTGEIFRVNTDANTLATTLSVPENDALIGISAVGYDAVNQTLYVTRLPVNDSGGPLYTANGTALLLDRSGAVVGRFETGNAPGHIAFLRSTQ